MTKRGVTAVAMEQLSKYAHNSGKAVFSVIRAATVVIQRRGKHASSTSLRPFK
jgi:hypothetical protein